MKNDQMLMKRVAAGDGQAFAELVTPYRAELLRFAHGMLRADGQASEEVVQEAMLKAYRALEQGTRPESVRPWLFQIVRNAALNAQRRSQPTFALADGDSQVAQRTPSDAAEQGEWMDWLMAAITELPSRQRQALVGRELEGRSHAELAASLGTSVLAVKTLLYRARGTLRKMRAESMLSVPLFIKGRLAGAKAGLGVLGQAMFAASVTSLIVLAVHAGGVGSVHAAGLPTVRARAAVSHHRSRSSARPAPRRLSREQVQREAEHAIKRCEDRLPVRGASPEALMYAAGHLSATELEYTECQQILTHAALKVLTNAGLKRKRRSARAGVYFARSSGGLLIEATRGDPLLVRPSSIVVFPHQGWSITALRWTSWGGSIVRATGTSVEAQCEPGCTGGPQAGSSSSSFQSSSATVVLSSPGAFDGHTVYRCFRVTAANSVPSSVAGCSGRGRQPKPAVRG
jgi:RNA polymerase sigma factor (sigma-70 family)